jgi:hypothetical protein
MDNYDEDIYVEWLTTATVTFARELNWIAMDMDSYQSTKSNQSRLKNMPWIL